MFRQGDVLITEVDEIPAGCKTVKRVRGKGLVLAEGEATGHHHQVKNPHARMFEFGGRKFLRIPSAGAEVEHEEHDAIPLDGGTYEVTRQREYVPPAEKTAARTSYVYD